MNANELKSAMIFGLNHNLADELLETIVSVMDAYETGGLHELEGRLFRLSVDIDSLKRACHKNRMYLQEYRREAEEANADVWRMNRYSSHAVGMEMQ